MPERYQVTGLKELRDAMLRLPKEIRGRPLRDALFSAGKVIRDEAIRLAPHRTGRLAMNIVVAPSTPQERSTMDDAVVVVVRQRGKKQDPYNAFYWKFVEFGHRVRPRKGAVGTDLVRTTRVGRYGLGGFVEGLSHSQQIQGTGTSARYGRSAGQKLLQSVAGAKFVPAQPFMRPAFETRKQDALGVFAIKFKIALEKAVAKVRRVR